MDYNYLNPHSIISKPKYNANVNIQKPSSYYDYENFNIEWSPQDDYHIVKKIGRGKYSEVFQGINIRNNTFCAIKILKPVRKSKINREIKILQTLSGGPNIVELFDVCRDPVSNTPSLVFEYIENTDFRVLYNTMSEFESRCYLYDVLTALEYTHSCGIIHRDIKPNNIMYDAQEKILRVCDWGLADFYFPGNEYNVRVSTRYFKGPELLLDYKFYHYSLDMWSFGCMMAGIIFKKEPFFKGNDNDDQLRKILQVFGTEDVEKYIENYSIKLNSQTSRNITQCTKVSLDRFVNKRNKNFVSPEAVDLLTSILVVDHCKRIYPSEAKRHPYFKAVREIISDAN